MSDTVNDVIDETANQAKSATDHTANAAKVAADRLREGADQARGALDKHVVEPARRTGEAMREAGKRVDEGRAEVGVKIIDQAETNAHLVFDALRRAAKAENVSDVIAIHGEFLREQARRSADQAREIGELIMQFGREAAAPLQKAAEAK